MSNKPQALLSMDKVLLLSTSVADGLNSREAQAVANESPSTQINVVTPAEWQAMSAQEFMSYRAIIIGDAACQSGTAAFQAAIDNRNVWGAIVDGDVAILGTDPSSNGTAQLVENGIRFVLNSMQDRTGMYISLGCAYQDAPANTVVELLQPLGEFKVAGVPGCATSAHMFEMWNDLMTQGISDGMLSGNGCAARSVFTQYPDRNFSYVALATDSSGGPIPGQRIYTDVTVNPGVETNLSGTPYILVRGAMTRGAGCGIPEQPSGEECDMGDGLNGQPAIGGETSWQTCSYSCHYNWCGDGIVDTEFGEECDNGTANGRTSDWNGDIGACTSFCKLPNLEPLPTQPPTALCKNVTVVAEYACGISASIDNGSFDPDSDLSDCTQSPAGPYAIGDTTVTLTCMDHTGKSSECTGVVTVTDAVHPTVALNGSESESLECLLGGTYSDPGAAASDLCGGELPASSIAKTGSVNLAIPGTYALTYVATDSAGNKSEPSSRVVIVRDTLAPQLNVLPGPSTLACNGAPYVDPGATATDACTSNLTGSITTTTNLDQARAGQYSVNYRVTDAAGNVGTAARQLTVGPCATCIEVRLSDYNLFVLENYTNGHDVQGKVAAGGNISMQDFAVGGSLPASDTSNVLVAGGNLSLSRGSIWGNGWYGGTYTYDQGVTPRRGPVQKGTPIDFNARFAELRSLSTQLAALTANGTTKRESWGGIFLKGTSATTNVFDVNASAFTGAAQFNIQAPAGSLVVINIRGASATFQNFGYNLTGGIDQHGILYNFVDATTINASSFGFRGTVLAPHARVTFNNGSWDGGIYAKSMTGTAEGHVNVLYNRDICP